MSEAHPEAHSGESDIDIDIDRASQDNQGNVSVDSAAEPLLYPAGTVTVRGRGIVVGVFGMAFAMTLLAVVLPSLLLRNDARDIDVYGTMPPFRLHDQTGAEFTEADLRDKVIIVSFLFTRCQTVCPVLAMKLSRIQENTTDVADDVKLISFSVDPDHDTPEVLARYASLHHADPARWRFLTGDRTTGVQAVSNGLAVGLERIGTTPGGAPDIAHDEHFILLDRSSRVRGYYDSNDIERINQLLRDARRLVIHTR